jgi:DDE family transposase
MSANAELLELMVPELELLLPELDEKSRRLTLGAVARAAGDGGIGAVARMTGASWQTVANGAAELDSGQFAPEGRVRRAGAGRPRLAETDPGLVPALLALVEDSVRGDPASPLAWTTKSAVHLAGELTAQGHACSPQTAWRLLREQGFSTQANAKVAEGRRHPDRDGQFRYIAGQAREHLAAGQPVISVDAKKKEQVGEYAQGGREWRPKGDPVRVRDHDFADRGEGHAIPYGIYDVGANTGFVNVGTDHNTAALAVESIRRWWNLAGQDACPAAARLLVCCDAGGSNGWRNRAWKAGLAALAAETGLQITCCHFPPGTSKWNKIEHRLFSQITLAWRGRPLTSYDVILSTIAAVTTRTGLAVTAVLDENPCPAGTKVSDEQMRDIEERHLRRHEFHGEWNYALLPVPRPAPPPAPPAPPPAPAGLCGPAALNHPALTGLDPAALDALAAALEAPLRGWREQRRYARTGRPRARTGREGGWNRKLDPAGHLLAARLRAHLNLPVTLVGALLGIHATTVSHATSRTATVLAGLPPGQRPAAAPPPAIRLRTLDDLRAYAARHGITIPQPADPPQPSTVQDPDTPQTHLTLE